MGRGENGSQASGGRDLFYGTRGKMLAPLVLSEEDRRTYLSEDEWSEDELRSLAETLDMLKRERHDGDQLLMTAEGSVILAAAKDKLRRDRLEQGE